MTDLGDRVTIGGTVQEIAAGTAIIALDTGGLAPVPIEACDEPEREILGAITVMVPSRAALSGVPGLVLGWGISFIRAENGDFLLRGDTGQPVTTALRFIIHARADGVVHADLCLFVTADGEPIFDGQPVMGDDAEPLTDWFRFVVQEIRAGG